MDAAIVWFRNDLRLDDNPAWSRAVQSGRPVVPVYIHAPDECGDWAPGGASMWWLYNALEDLRLQLEDIGSRLIVRSGCSSDQIGSLLAETGARSLYWNRCYEPWRVRLDGKLKADLQDQGIEVWSGNSSLLREPWEVSTQQGGAYRVYTPYAKACSRMVDKKPVANPGAGVCPDHWPDSLSVKDLELLPAVGWDTGIASAWKATRKGGLERIESFLRDGLSAYDTGRDIPGVEGTARISPYLRFGQIGPREVAAALNPIPESNGKLVFYKELIWREFAYHVLYHFPTTTNQPLQPAFQAFPWRRSEDELEAWQKGRTGFPIVDAGMRQLWQTGWMHNRVRMIVASFLVKHLLHSWMDGAAWFWDTLVDADLASNTLGWQWAGGCGADAAPYFRVFNPILQGQKFDPAGDYIRRFVPELGKLPKKMIHTPWELSTEEENEYECRLEMDYPRPIIAHRAGRERALKAWEEIKK